MQKHPHFRGKVMTNNQFALLVGIVGIVPAVYPLNYYIQLWPSSQRILDTEQEALAGMTCEDPGQVVLYKESERVRLLPSEITRFFAKSKLRLF